MIDSIIDTVITNKVIVDTVVDTIIVIEKLNIGFWTIFIPALLAFIFSFVLFLVTKFSESRVARWQLCKKVKREFELNINYLQNLILFCNNLRRLTFDENIDELIRKQEQLVEPIYQIYKRYFTDSYHSKGYFYDILTNEQIENLEKILYLMKTDQQRILLSNFSSTYRTRGFGYDWGRVRNYITKREKKYTEFIKILQKIKMQLKKGIFSGRSKSK